MNQDQSILGNNTAFATVINIDGKGALVTSTTKRDVSEPVKKQLSSGKISPWGEDNLRPQNIVTLSEKSDLIPRIVDYKSRAIYSQGINYGFEIIENGKKILQPVELSEIDDMLEAIAIDRYLEEAANDYNLFKNVFVEFRKKALGGIIDIGCTDATFCRLEKQNTKTGIIDNVYVNPDWDNGGKESDSEVIQAINPYYMPVEQIRNSKKLKMIMPLRSQKNGRVYYDRADWEGLIDSGWLDLAQQIPTFKKSLMNNQLSVKWHVQIPSYYWSERFKNWDSMTEVQQEAKRTEVLTTFTSFLKGAQNAGSAFISSFGFNVQFMKEYPTWKIEPLKTEFKGGEYIEDSQEADYHIMRAFGVHPQLIGSTPGKGRDAGSGSDIRVAFNKHVLMEKPTQDKLLSPLRLLSAVNNWSEKYKTELNGKRLKFWCATYFMATLDQVNNEKRM